MLPVAMANTGAMYFSNLAMRETSAPFTQTVKSIVPAFTYIIYKYYQGRKYSREHDIALLAVFFGVVVASNADASGASNPWGLGYALLASVCTALNAVLSNDKTKNMNPLEAMNVMAPYSIAMLLPVWYNTELEVLHKYWDQVSQPQVVIMLFLHGLWVFALNFVSQFRAAVVSPVLGTCSGNMKVVFIYIFSWML